MTTPAIAPTYVADPFPMAPTDRCELTIHPSADEVLSCENRAVAVIIAPCCGHETKMCRECLGKCGGLGSWRCNGCGLVADCKWTPIEFGFRSLSVIGPDRESSARDDLQV